MRKSKHRDIALEIRRRVLSGKLRPEEQLPTRVKLEREFRVGRVTMQKAVDILVNDGTVHARGTYGTFVSKFPMEIYHMMKSWKRLSKCSALIFPNSSGLPK